MSKTCNNCGHSVDDSYNFCPNCGAQLEDEIKKDIIICSNCGSENSVYDSFCTECGAKLENSKADTKKIQPTSSQHTKSVGKPRTHKNKKKKKTIEKTDLQQTKKDKGKSLSKGQLRVILIGVLGLLIIFLWKEGVFDKPVTPTNNTPPPSGPQVNLANIQKINELDAQVKANPNNMELLLQLAHLRNDSGFFQQAINNYQTYLEKKPNDVDARIDMGVCYYNLKNFKKAIEEMEKAVKIKPNHQIGLLNLGVVNLTAGNAAKSAEWLKKAIKVNPNSEFGKRAQELLNAHKSN